MSRGGCLSLSLSLYLLLSLCLSLSVTTPSSLALPVNSRLILLLTSTVMHFCFFPDVLALPPLPPLPPHPESCLTSPLLPRPSGKISVSLIGGPGKLALLSFLSILPASSLPLSSPSARCPMERTPAHPQIQTSKYMRARTDSPRVRVSGVCLQVGCRLIGRSR